MYISELALFTNQFLAHYAMSNKIQCECLIQLSSTWLLGDAFYFNMSPSRHNRIKEEDNMKLSSYKGKHYKL